jgi:hypothetical protein
MRRAVLSVGILGLLLASATCQQMRTFTHPTLGFAISAPAAWKPDTSDPEVAVGFETPEDSSFYLAVTTAPMPATFASESVYRQVADGFSSEFCSEVATSLEIDASKVMEFGRRVHEVRGMQVATLDFRAPAPDDWVYRARAASLSRTENSTPSPSPLMRRVHEKRIVGEPDPR